MTWSAFFNALRGGAQNRVQSVRQGVNRATQQTTTRPAQRAAVSTKAVDNIKQDDFDFLGMDVSILYLEYFYHLRFHLNVLLHGYHSLTRLSPRFATYLSKARRTLDDSSDCPQLAEIQAGRGSSAAFRRQHFSIAIIAYIFSTPFLLLVQCVGRFLCQKKRRYTFS